MNTYCSCRVLYLALCLLLLTFHVADAQEASNTLEATDALSVVSPSLRGGSKGQKEVANDHNKVNVKDAMRPTDTLDSVSSQPEAEKMTTVKTDREEADKGYYKKKGYGWGRGWGRGGWGRRGGWSGRGGWGRPGWH